MITAKVGRNLSKVKFYFLLLAGVVGGLGFAGSVMMLAYILMTGRS